MMNNVNNPSSTAVIGGGISGLASAYYVKLHNPAQEVHVFEREPAESYAVGSESGAKRASLGASGNRMMRQMGHDETSRWAIHQTFDMIQNLQTALDADAVLPADQQHYAHIHHGVAGSQKLIEPQASLSMTEDKTTDKKYAKTLQSLKDAGLTENVGYMEMKGNEVKKLYPGLFEALSNTADVLIEAPYGEDAKAISGAMNAELILHVLVGEMNKAGVQFHFGEGAAQVTDLQNGKVGLVGDSGAQYMFDKAVVAPGAGLNNFIAQEKQANPATPADVASIANLNITNQRVIMADVDLGKLLAGNAKGIALNPALGVPLSKGAGFTNNYGWSSHSKDMHVKLYPAELVKDASSPEELYAPVSADENAQLMHSVVKQYGLQELFPNMPPEALIQKAAEATQVYSCQYVVPTQNVKRQVVMPFNPESNIILNGVDSSSAWRIAGNGLNAARQSLGLPAPEEAPALYDRFSFEEHQKLTMPVDEKTMPKAVVQDVRDALPLEQPLQQRGA